MTDVKIIITGVIPYVTEVRLYNETIEHVKEEHPEIPAELPSISAAVETAIVNPTHVVKSHGPSYVYVDANTTNHGGDPLRVPVKVIEGTSGRIRTFYFASKEGDEDIVWSRTDG